nr:MAG: ORF1 [TTV-like mini virus]
MPPYYRRRYYYRRNWWNSRNRRNKYRRRRFRRAFQTKRRPRWVRKKFYRKKLKKKLKQIKITEWQPQYIKRCHIKGYLLAFEAGHGAFGQNFALYKESFNPEREPGGGGWSIQCLNLGNLFVQNSYIMNRWTKSNVSLNLCRYYGARLTLFRQPNIDWIFTYYTEEPQRAGKYWYPSFHPMQLILDKKRIIVPSLKTQPLKRKIYKRIYIRPPKQMKNEWYFQAHISDYPLVTFAAVACSLSHMFLSSKSINNNITVISLNTRFFTKPAFQYTSQPTGYNPKDGTYVYALENGHIGELKLAKKKDVIYLGETHIKDLGIPIGINHFQQYKREDWGNIFDYQYLNLIRTVFLNTSPTTFLNNVTSTDTIGDVTQKLEPLIFHMRYNPYKDKGDGNVAFWKSVSDVTKNNWDEPTDEDLKISGYPFWLMLWGWADYTKKLGKITRLEDNYMLVLKSKYFDEKMPAYVPLGESFVNGRAPWNNDPEDINTYDRRNWFPRWRFQIEAVDAILSSGPGVCKAEGQDSIQAFFKYDFFFKWGGDPATIEKISDPNSQPTSVIPREDSIRYEITDPKTSIQNQIYSWETRRDFLTQKATERIKECPTNDTIMFTDGIQTSTDIPWKTTTQTQTASEKEEEEIFINLQQLQQYNQELKQRLNRLRQLTTDK